MKKLRFTRTFLRLQGLWPPYQASSCCSTTRRVKAWRSQLSLILPSLHFSQGPGAPGPVLLVRGTRKNPRKPEVHLYLGNFKFLALKL